MLMNNITGRARGIACKGLRCVRLRPQMGGEEIQYWSLTSCTTPRRQQTSLSSTPKSRGTSMTYVLGLKLVYTFSDCSVSPLANENNSNPLIVGS